MNSLLPRNSTAIERAVEAAMRRAFDIASPQRDLWNPDTCPEHLLPWLAWGLSIDNWAPYWTVTVKRARIRAALDIQRRKGTADSVHKVVEAFGGAVLIREWWQNDPPTQPHTFDLVLTVSGDGGETASAQYVADVIAEIQRTKPVRSHFTFTQGANAVGGVGIVAAARVATYRRLQLDVIEDTTA